MKYLTFILCILILSCSAKNNNMENRQISEVPSEDIVMKGEINKIMYVNSLEGLRVRKEPNINSEKIYLLTNLQHVIVTKKDTTEITIDDIKGNWYFIKADEITGWVFSGYLSDTIIADDDIKIISGKYYYSSVDIQIQENIDISPYMINGTEIYLSLELISGYEYMFEYNYPIISSRNIDNNKHEVFIWNNSKEPFYEILGDGGGTHTYVYFYYKDNNIIMHLDYVEVDIRGFENPEPVEIIDRKPTQKLIFDMMFRQ